MTDETNKEVREPISGNEESNENEKIKEPDSTLVLWVRILLISVIGIGFICMIFYGIYDKKFLGELSRTELARGFITFVIAIGTLALAFLLMIYTITFRIVRKADYNAFKDRFGRGQQVLTALVGILGTIVGFYFGTAVTETKKPEFTISPVKINNPTPKPGDKIKLTSVVQGGQAPYKYSLSFDPPDINPIEKTSSTGNISQSIEIKQDATPGTEISITFKVTDDTGKSKTIGKEENPKIKVMKPKPLASKPPGPGG